MDQRAFAARSCQASATRWRRQAGILRASARARHLTPDQAATLLREAEAAERMATWWDRGAEEALATP